MKTNRFINIKVALFIAVSALMAACTIEDADQSVEPKSEQLDLAEELNMTATETDKSFDVTSDSGWDISIEGGWTGLTVSPMSGNGKSQVTIHTEANTTRQGREATISIKTKGGVTQKMVVKQALSDVILNLTGGDSQTLEYEASPQDSKKISFTCNSTWEVTSSDNWIKCADAEGKTSGGDEISTVVATTISVSVDEIQTDVPREGKIVISAENGARTAQVTVKQEGKLIELSVSPKEFDVVATGENKTIQIACNADWTIEFDKGDFVCDQITGTGNQNVVITCLPNNVNTERKVTLKVSSGIENIKTETITFTQAAATPPVLTAFSLVEGSVKKNEAEFLLSFDTMFPIAEYGIYVWEDSKSESTKTPIQDVNTESGITQLKFKATGLKSMTTYHAYGFIKNTVGSSDSQNTSVVTFTTGGVKPSDDDNPTPSLSR
jgi:hypothetical protein